MAPEVGYAIVVVGCAVATVGRGGDSAPEPTEKSKGDAGYCGCGGGLLLLLLPMDPILKALPEELARLPVELPRPLDGLAEATLLGLLPILDDEDDGGEIFCCGGE